MQTATERFSAKLSEAGAIARLFARAEITALEAERELLFLGFYNVTFSPVSAAIAGVWVENLEEYE